ncbi:MAG: hypothetical protein KatS3mg112_0334 [Thermogutta sp.]|nr:MAG: hypothetical protein KatS3mg112_0334 [Thermogutta sp.]
MNCPYRIGGTFSGGTRLSGPSRHVRLSIPFPGHNKRAPPTFQRDVLVTSEEHRLITHPSSPGTTSVPLRDILRRDLLVRSVFFRRDVLVTSARLTLDHPLVFSGD